MMFPHTAVRCLLLLLPLASCGARITAAQEASPQRAHEPALRYRRVYVPQADFKQFTPGHFPLQRDKFEELVERATQRTRDAEAAPAWIESADYTAVYADGQFTAGVARLRVMHTSGVASHVLLSPCNLAMGAAVWEDGEAGTEATVGNDLAGNLLAMVPTAGTLRFPWSLRGVSGRSDETQFDVALPPSPLNRLILDLPEQYQLLADRGIVLPAEAVANVPVPSTLPSVLRRWVVQLGGVNRLRLIVASPEAMRGRQQIVSVQQDTRYRLLEDGLEVDCDLELEIQRQPLKALLFRVEPDLHITSVRLGTQELDWSLAGEPVEHARQLQVRFPEPLSGIHPALQISAMGPLKTDTMWRLPQLHVEGVFWRQGSMSLLLPDSLSLRHLVAHAARQAERESAEAVAAVVARRYELFSPDGYLELSVVRTPAQLEGTIGTTIDLELNSLRAEIMGDFSCSVGQHFLLEADVPHAWTLDGIDSEPANRVEDYRFVAFDTGHKRLQIRLTRPLTPQRPTRLIVRARRTQAFVLSAEDLRPLRFHNLGNVTSLIAIAPDPSLRLDVAGDVHVERMDADSVPPGQAELVRPRGGGILFRDSHHADTLTVKITREDPTFTVQQHVLAEVTADTLTETYRLQCTPESSSLNRFVVFLTEQRQEPVSWTLEADGNALLSARMLTNEERQQTRFSQAGEAWEFVLRQPQQQPFTLHGTRKTRFLAAQRICLVSFPEAASQEGWLSIESLDGSTMAIKASAVKAIPSDPRDPYQHATSRARFRFDVSRNAQVIVEHATPRAAQAALWAWHCLLVTQVLETGQTRHEATYLLESAGGSEFSFRLPAGYELLSVEVDGTRVARPLRAEPAGAYELPLPPELRYPRVLIAYASPTLTGGLVSRLSIQTPVVEFPVLDRRWTVWLAPELLPIAGQEGVYQGQAESMTWTRRLLGPLAAPAHSRPFNFLEADDWTRFVRRSVPYVPVDADGQMVLQVLGEEYLAMRARPTGGAVTWRELWERLRQRVAELPEPVDVWVDAQALEQDGFALNDVPGELPVTVPLQIGRDLLTTAGLVIVAHGDVVLVTSRDGLTRVPAAVQASLDPAVMSLRDGSAGAAQVAGLTRWSSAAWLPLAAWVAEPAVADVPWTRNPGGAYRGIEGSHWHACEVQLDVVGAGRLTVVRRGVLNALSWAGLLAAVGCVGWWGAARPGRVLVWLVMICVVGMLIPATWVPVTAHLILGTLLGGLLVMVRSRDGAAGPAMGTGGGNEARSSRWSTAARLTLFVAFLLGGREVIRAEETAAVQTPDASRLAIPQVIIPVDQNLQPVGQYDYLPLDFLDALRRRAGESSSGQDWLVRRANYRAVFNWTQQRSTLDLASLMAVYQLELYRPGQQIIFPWRADDPAVQIREARLGGQPIQLLWNRERTAFQLTVPAEGITQLELVLLPITTEDAGGRALEFAIPTLARSQLRIEAPFDAPVVEASSAVGETSVDIESGDQLVELGPTPTLALRWEAGVGPRVASRQADVQQLIWLRVRPKERPESVVLDTRIRVRSGGGSVDQVLLQVDPRLRLRPSAGDLGVEIDESGMGKDGGGLLVIRPRQPITQELMLPLQFEVLSSTGLGNLAVPRLEVLNGRVEQRWLAISVAPSLEFTSAPSDTFTTLEVAEFLTLWGDSESAPQICYRMKDEDPTWSIQTRSRQPQTTACQELDVSVGPTFLDLMLTANLQTTNGTTYQHAVTVPQGFEVTEIKAVAEEKSMPADAHHDGSGRLTVFLEQGLTGASQIQLRGQIQVSTFDSAVPLPLVALQDVTLESSLVRVYRQPHVLVTVEGARDQEPVLAKQLGQFRDAFGRLVAAWDPRSLSDDALQDVRLRVRPNQPVVDARLVTLLRRVEDSWEAVAECEMRVTNAPQGVVDQFRFEIPEEWAAPFALEPDMPYEVRPLPGQKRHLIIRPPQPVVDRFSLRIAGSLTLAANERGRTPNIVPLDVNHAERFFVLPSQLDQQRIDWETSGLRLIPLVEALPEGLADPQGYVAYAVYSRPRAVIADVQRVAGERQISLADVHVVCHEDGSCSGVVGFDIEPAGMPGCTLEVPAECELVQATVEGVPATLLALADRRWQLQMMSEQLPQQVGVLFHVRAPQRASSRIQEIRVPWITDVTVTRTLWTVYTSPGQVPVGAALAKHRVTAAAQEALRVRGTSGLIESAVESVVESPAAETKAWYLPWATRLALSEAALIRAQAQTGDRPLISSEALAALDEQQKRIHQRLNVTPSWEELRARTVRHPLARDLLTFGQAMGRAGSHYAFLGKAETLSIEHRALSGSDRWARLAGSLLVAALGGFLLFAWRAGLISLGMRRWPYAWSVGAGLAWWLFAFPSWFGWVIVLASLWGALRGPVPAYPIARQEAASGSEATS